MITWDVAMCGVLWGAVWGSLIFVFGLASAVSGKGRGMIRLLGKVYLGFKETLGGILIGGMWGFLDGCLSGMAAAWIYHQFVK